MSQSYTPAPEIPRELAERVQAILYSLTGHWSVTEAAEKLGLSRNHFQTLKHEATAALVEALTPGKAGRPAAEPELKELRERVEKLERENSELRRRAETIDRLMEVAGGILRGQVRTRGRSTKTKAKKGETPSSESEDPDGAARRRVEEAARMRALGLSAPLAAAVVGLSASTLRRWSQRLRAGARVSKRSGTGSPTPLPLAISAQLEARVRVTHGLCGAEALRRSVPGVSRRQAAAAKQRTLTAMERERIARCLRLRIAAAGVIRGADQLYVRCGGAVRTVFVSADASVPYRTSACLLSRYDASEVRRAIERDFSANGAPLVWRADRASSHRTPEILELLRAHRVLPLHGPPRHPQYYGQLERQNREHRAWLRGLLLTSLQDLDTALEQMLAALNHEWPRRELGWRTPAAAWRSRPSLAIDRDTLRDDVEERAARLNERMHARNAHQLAGRLAIEQALEHRGLLSREAGGWC